MEQWIDTVDRRDIHDMTGTYLIVELISPAESLVVEESTGAPVSYRALLLLLVRVEHIEEGEQIALGHLEVPLGHPRLVALVRRLKVHVLDLRAAG